MCPNGSSMKDFIKQAAGAGVSSGGGASTGTIAKGSGTGLLASVLPRLRAKQTAPILDTQMTPNGG